MEISVILCTYNRCQDLTKTLESLASSRLPSAVEWEVVVVDNNSSDPTRRLAEDFCRRYPLRFTYLFEPMKGKSYALNAGIREARGDLLAFTDDDVTVEPTWLDNLTLRLRDNQCAGVGGRTLLDRSLSLPHWLSLEGRDALGPLAIFDRGMTATELLESPFGNNMAFRKEIFVKHGNFRTDLGPQPDKRKPQKGEDSEFGRRLLVAGERLLYEPAAVIYHRVSPDRITKKSFLSWWYDKGMSDIRIVGLPHDTRWTVAGIPLYLFRRLLRWAFQWMISVRASQRFSCKARVWNLAGMIRACRLRKLLLT
jgi:glycosyltransferase involved in cell wall biosynthesis